MKIQLICIGKTHSQELKNLIQEYQKRLPTYIQFEIKELSDIKNAKNLSPQELKAEESHAILSQIDKSDLLILLDEKGKEFTSIEFSQFINNNQNQSTKRMVFAIGGALGFSDLIKSKAHFSVSLSRMTFTHQMIRLFFVEQLYRAFSILQGKPYHNI